MGMKKAALLSILVVTVQLAVAVIAEAQQPKVAKIGLLRGSFREREENIEMLRRELSKFGYVDGKNIAFEFRAADNKFDRFPALVDELVRLKVDILTINFYSGCISRQKSNRNDSYRRYGRN